MMDSGYGIRVCTLEEIGEQSWRSFISASGGTVYHDPAWHRAIEITYGISPVYLARFSRDGAIEAAMPCARIEGLLGKGRLVSYPFSDVCGPLGSSAPGPVAFIRAISEFFEAVEVRSAAPLKLQGYSAYRGYVNFTLGLDGTPDQVFDGFHRDCVQRRISKALRSGLVASEGASPKDLKEFYSLHLETRKRQGAPVQPLSFFRNLWAALHQLGMASLIIVRNRRRAVAGVLLLRFGKTAYYKFGASSRGAASAGASQLALWSAIRKASDDGCTSFDFGRTFTGNRGLMEFKARWGASPSQLWYIKSPEKKVNLKDEGGSAARVASAVFRALPRQANRLIGALFYRYLA